MRKIFNNGLFRLALFAMANFSVFVSAMAQNSQSVIPQNLSEDCKRFISTTLVNNHWQGGFMWVPKDWKNPESSPRVAVFYFHNTVENLDESTPVLFLNGGPFASYQRRMEALNKQLLAYQNANKKVVFVMMDQRGTGCSVPLRPQPGENLDLQEYTNYGAEAVVRDAEAIRQYLFPNKQWTLFAQSYGSFLTTRYIHLFPQHIREAHVHGPTLHESMTDFFYFRIKRQNFVFRKFIDTYSDDNLMRAVEKMNSPDAQKYCLDATATAPKLCGRVLLDPVLANLGQGKGRGINQTEIWDSTRDALLNFIESQPDPAHPKYQAFIKYVNETILFFREPTSMVVTVLWAQESHYRTGDEVDDCLAAEDRLRAEGIDAENLPVNGCRIIRYVRPKEFGGKLKANFERFRGRDIRLQSDLIAQLQKNSHIRFYLYTAELDSLAQVEPLQTLIQSPDVVNYTHFTKSGHAGWLFEPLIWQRLLN